MSVLRRTSSIWQDADELVESLQAWADRHGHDGYIDHVGMTRGEMLAYARTLGPKPDPQNLLDRKFLMGHYCHSCETWTDFVATIGEEPDYETATTSMCLPCLRAALAEAEIEYERHKRRAAKP